MYMSGKKKIAIIVIIGALLLAISGVGYWHLVLKDSTKQSSKGTKKDNGNSTSNNPISDAQKEALAKIEESAKKEQQRIDDLTKQTTNAQQLSKLSTQDQAAVGITKIKESIASGDSAGAKTYIEVLMKRNDAAGLEASKLCYQQATTSQEKQVCSDRANQLAHDQGLLPPGEKLSEEYLMEKPAVEQG